MSIAPLHYKSDAKREAARGTRASFDPGLTTMVHDDWLGTGGALIYVQWSMPLESCQPCATMHPKTPPATTVALRYDMHGTATVSMPWVRIMSYM